MILHKKMGEKVREGELLFTLFAEVDGSPPEGSKRRAITTADVDAACARSAASDTTPNASSSARTARARSNEAIERSSACLVSLCGAGHDLGALRRAEGARRLPGRRSVASVSVIYAAALMMRIDSCWLDR